MWYRASAFRWPVALAAFVLPVPSTMAAQSTFTIEDVALLKGCWVGDLDGIELREQWSDGGGGMMLGTTRFFRDGRVVDFEFGMFIQDENGVTLWPYPKGERSANGFPLVSTSGELVFENLAHDFPVRIIYRPRGTSVYPRIEGRDGQVREWLLNPVACPDSGERSQGPSTSLPGP